MERIKNFIFLIDAIGAFLSFIFLVVISKLEYYFGMPSEITIVLAFIALSFCIYSSIIHFIPNKGKRFLSIILLFNLLYTVTTFVLIILYQQELKLLGWFYFIGELVILIFLIRLEFKILRNN